MLIFPDSPERSLLGATLGRAGHPVSLAGAALPGCRLAALDRPELIVADLALPEVDGYACCRLLKADPACAAIPLILVGADAGPRERTAGLLLGAVDFLSKPYDMDELLARIRVHLGLAARAREGAPATALNDTGEAARPLELDMLVLATACRVIDANLASLPALPEIARAAGTYRERLNALFNERLGMSVFEHVRERRHARALQLLRETDLGVGEIAVLVGFRNARNFSTAFRERSGMAPLAWRRAARGGSVGTE
ncbi:DNA-binding response regulator [Massilia sp. 9096]|uniref:response regulator transcription factor n=1 Tax=Massilia sp. 9096 TaxID=1500894 RepID=UPI00068EC577|nr:DNA-binding response regulator [Massilia sp. 9096]